MSPSECTPRNSRKLWCQTQVVHLTLLNRSIPSIKEYSNEHALLTSSCPRLAPCWAHVECSHRHDIMEDNIQVGIHSVDESYKVGIKVRWSLHSQHPRLAPPTWHWLETFTFSLVRMVASENLTWKGRKLVKRVMSSHFHHQHHWHVSVSSPYLVI